MKTFRIDPHVHASETSACSWISGSDMAAQYKALGYDGIAITDHLHEGYISSLPCRDNWDACVDKYLSGYRAAKAMGEKVGLALIFGVEIRFTESDNDYLLYGMDEQFLRAHPYPYRNGLEDFYNNYHDKLLIIQAHPYRGGGDNIRPRFLHGVEAVNDSPRHDSHNQQAFALAEEHSHLIRTCGSDAHRPGELGRAAMVFDFPVHDSLAYKEALEKGAYHMECPNFRDLIEKYT
ncbi:putative PHP domain protein [Treponema primitia ZAS-2]|uniref:Putative PHP domain protein n=1 Tax=Treponema primitia (strain ATCC BAA-887 / DSM 12427 / ZAS-2) TaxID=545694 RepID=F5YKF1_TREPZ|nr:PHP domain-containing protein [Treponema primitia]AEF85010.1 putative PHP domain protein [Treponema primitia ZAS-2]